MTHIDPRVGNIAVEVMTGDAYVVTQVRNTEDGRLSSIGVSDVTGNFKLIHAAEIGTTWYLSGNYVATARERAYWLHQYTRVIALVRDNEVDGEHYTWLLAMQNADRAIRNAVLYGYPTGF